MPTGGKRNSHGGGDAPARAIQAARALAEQGGYDAVQIRDVVKLSGVSSATIYRYFASKDHLLGAVRQAWIEEFDASDRAERWAGMTAIERVMDVVRSVCDHVRRTPQLSSAIIIASTAHDAKARAAKLQADRIHSAVLRKGLGPTFENADELVRMLELAMEGTLVEWAHGDLTIDEAEHLIHEMATHLLSGAAGGGARFGGDVDS